jgi:FkbM family methyltransferase
MSVDTRRGNIFVRAARRLTKDMEKSRALNALRRQGVAFEAPDFIYFPRLNANSRVIDVGCSFEADFSQTMIRNFGAKAFAVDPTRKHAEALKQLEKKYDGKLVYLPFAVCDRDGTLTFHESKTNQSGSVRADHVNVMTDEIVKYDVTAVSLTSLLQHVGGGEIDILKLDTEGAEYDLLNDVTREDLRPFKQMFIEFHHHAVDKYDQADTQRIVDRITGFGFKPYTVDNANFLFERIN